MRVSFITASSCSWAYLTGARVSRPDFRPTWGGEFGVPSGSGVAGRPVMAVFVGIFAQSSVSLVSPFRGYAGDHNYGICTVALEILYVLVLCLPEFFSLLLPVIVTVSNNTGYGTVYISTVIPEIGLPPKHS